MPYSDPLMDGPVIQQAVEAALRGGHAAAGRPRCGVGGGGGRRTGAGDDYWNSIDRYGVDAFARGPRRRRRRRA